MAHSSHSQPTVLDMLKELKEYIIVLALLASVIGYLAYNLHKLPVELVLVKYLFWCSVPAILFLIYFFNLRPAMTRQKELNMRPVGRPASNYFTTSPRTDGDKDLFSGKPEYERILNWVQAAREPILMLTGLSGVGKTSLINAYLAPALEGTRDPKFKVVQLRATAEPLERLKEALGPMLESGTSAEEPGSALEMIRSLDTSIPNDQRVLFVIDQFEEFFLMHASKDERAEEQIQNASSADGSVAEVSRFFEQLVAHPPAHISILISYREDHQPWIDLLKLPARTERHNWMTVYPMSITSAREFIASCPGLSIPKERMDRVIKEAIKYEENLQGIRPIVANILGLVLQYMVDHPTAWRKTDDLLRFYVESGLGKELKLDRARVLRLLLTDFRTATPHTVEYIANKTNWSTRKLENQLQQLAHHGLLRCLNPLDPAPGKHKWQIAHDFLALQVDRVIPGIHQTAWRTMRPWLAPAVLVIGFFLTSFLIVDPQERAVRALLEIGLIWDPAHATLETSSYGEEHLTSELILSKHAEIVLLHPKTIVNYSVRLKDLNWFKGLDSLTTLDVSGCDSLVDLRGLAGTNSLRTLDLSLNLQLADLEGIEGLSNLHKLDMVFCPNVTNFDPLKGLSTLSVLNVGGNTEFSDLDVLAGLSSITDLSIQGCTSIERFDGLRTHTALTRLNLARCTQLKDLSMIKGLASLRFLDISNCDSLTDLGVLTELRSLDTLRIKGCWVFENIDELPTLDQPTLIEIGDCKSSLTADTTALRVKFPNMSVIPPSVFNK